MSVVLRNPETPARVPGHRDRILHVGLGGEDVDPEPRRAPKAGRSLPRRQRPRRRTLGIRRLRKVVAGHWRRQQGVHKKAQKEGGESVHGMSVGKNRTILCLCYYLRVKRIEPLSRTKGLSIEDPILQIIVGFPQMARDASCHGPELWVGFYKKSSGEPSITWPESVKEALCFGWIDGVRKSIDDISYTIRFSPRKPVSIWSAVNVALVEELANQGLMRPAGLKAFETRKENRSGIYSYEQRSDTLPEPYGKTLRANKAAWDFFQAQPPSYRKTVSWWVVSAKREETRLKRLATLIDRLGQGRIISSMPRRKSRSKSVNSARRRPHFVTTKRSSSWPSAETWRTVMVAPSTSATVSEWTLETNLRVNSCQEPGSSCCSGL